MIFTTLDIICRRYLLEQGLPIHWYAEALFHSSTCFRELNIDTLKIINTRNLPVGENGEVDLPDDYLDDVMLSFDTGAILRPVPHKDSLNPLRLHSTSTGTFEGQPTNETAQIGSLIFPYVGRTWYWNVNDFGEPTGRMFGANGGNPYGYKVIKERRQIQLYGSGSGDSIILQYISDGQSVDSASQVDILAFDCINKYIIWKVSPNKNNEFSPEGRSFSNARRKLRSRLSDLSLDDIKDVIRKNYHAAIKN